MPDITDVLIVGGGYAGLAAANTLYRCCQTTMIFNSGQFRDQKASRIRLLPGFEDVQSSRYREIAKEELQQTGLCSFVEAEVARIEGSDGEGWTLITTDGEQYHGRKVVLATGTSELYPDIAGYADCWVTGIFPCMFQFGYEQRGCASAGVLIVDKLAAVLPQVVKLAGDTRKFAHEVVLYTNGAETVTNQLQELVGDTGFHIEPRGICRLIKEPEGTDVTIELEDGSLHKESFLVHQPWTSLRGPLPSQLGLETTPMGDIKVEHPFPTTSVPGVYAAGDCASPFKNASMAIVAGICAGNGIARELPTRLRK
jgi:thioredoxin reductase